MAPPHNRLVVFVQLLQYHQITSCQISFTYIYELKDDSYEKNKTMTNESSIDKIMTPVQIQNIHHDNTVNV